ncbi:MAG: aspartate dehydrogenase [Alphaproteobacteria bacterium]|nr:aspartate dehydrogenase [Alphaproteobacteria bacterium]
MAMPSQQLLSVGIAGLGAIGRALALRLAAGVAGLRLDAVAARDEAKARAFLGERGIAAGILPLEALARRCDIVVECLPAASFLDIAGPAIAAGKIFVPLSVGALLEHEALARRARETGARILVPTGALLGLDAVRAAAEGGIRSVRMVTRKPPNGLAGAPYLVQNGISVEGLTAPRRVFAGTAREGARGFPANVNVAAALSLAGIGADATMLEIWADPALERNTHTIEVDAEAARFTMTIAGIPSEENPRTGKITALSVVALLRGLTASLRVGS